MILYAACIFNICSSYMFLPLSVSSWYYPHSYYIIFVQCEAPQL